VGSKKQGFKQKNVAMATKGFTKIFRKLQLVYSNLFHTLFSGV